MAYLAGLLAAMAGANNVGAPLERPAYVVAYDGTFLGELTCDSIGDRFSRYGSRFSSSSIWNRFGSYGSPFAQYSAYNRFSNRPPAIFVNGRILAYVTTNRFKTPAIAPLRIEAALMHDCDVEDPYRDDE